MNYKIVTKYIKDISFKIPKAKTYYLLEKNINNYRVKIDIKSKKINESVLEIGGKEADDFKISLVFSSLINFEGKIDESKLEKIILIEIPTSIYPDLKKITSFLFQNSGFKTFDLPEMDFNKLYEDKKKN